MRETASAARVRFLALLWSCDSSLTFLKRYPGRKCWMIVYRLYHLDLFVGQCSILNITALGRVNKRNVRQSAGIDRQPSRPEGEEFQTDAAIRALWYALTPCLRLEE